MSVTDIRKSWCAECKAGRHFTCLDDGSSTAACSCRCGEKKEGPS